MDKELKTLFRLLDDDNEQSASLAMAGILEREGCGRLENILRCLQESNDSSMRKRVHQIQSIITIRRRRRVLAQNLETRSLNFVDGLVEMHMLWYDNDSIDSIRKEWADLMEESKSFRPSDLERLAYFMRKKGFACPDKGEVEADYYCLGTIIEEYIGADFMLCSIAKLVAAAWGLKLKITQLSGDFVLCDDAGHTLHPANDWKIVQDSRRSGKEWDAQGILKLIASMIFLCAVGTDSFRYVHTVGLCLSKACGGEGIENLPYPYNGASPKKESSLK